MGIVGRFIDAGEDRHRDRVIEAKGWCRDFAKDSCRCLVGHVENWTEKWVDEDCLLDERGNYLRQMKTLQGISVFNHFPHLCDRFGWDRVVRLCKMRAAKGNHELVEKIRNGIYDRLREEHHV